MSKEAIILAGGLGTRLQSVVSEVPKCLAPIENKPFLFYQIDYLIKQRIEHFILAIGYKKEQVVDFIQHRFPSIKVSFSIEEELLGTGGAIKQALDFTTEKHCLVLNGDSYFPIDLVHFYQVHQSNNALCTIALKPMINFSRYGSVELKQHLVQRFNEKSVCRQGLINGGIYYIDTEKFKKIKFLQKFSFENEFLSVFCQQKLIYGEIYNNYFIDIGIPEDYYTFSEKVKEGLI
ncbi:MAG: nucleotidyltransferase family protein [Sediminibacterium sp.]|nr:nucleotidyltransferase family protein [Sediminibacterium sp.]